MGLYKRSLEIPVKIRGSNQKALRGVLALGESIGFEALNEAEFIFPRGLYELMVSRGFYTPAPRSGRDRRVSGRRHGFRP